MLRKDLKSGFTLIELIVTLLIIAILAVVAIPSIRFFVQKYRIKGVAETLFTSLQYARSEAIKRNATVTVDFNTGDNWCYGISVGSACDCTNPSSCALGTNSASARGLITLSTTFSSNQVSFESTQGRPNSSGSVTFTLYNDTPLITLTVNSIGSIQMCSTGITGYVAC